ncbi:MAG: lipocalin-like domain-containing protein [Congregibacter sp.]
MSKPRRLPSKLCLAAAVSLGGCNDPQSQQDTGGLAALAASAEGFTQAAPETKLSFPWDHQAHDDYRIEWWYLTANLKDQSGSPYGAQWTLFRVAQRPQTTEGVDSNPWQDPQVYMAHFAISTSNNHHAFQRYARGGRHGGEARAGVSLTPFRAWIDDWFLRSSNTAVASNSIAASNTQAWLPLEVYARQDTFSLNLVLSSDQALVLQGDEGFSRKHPNGEGSHYYSQPFLAAEGELVIDEKAVRVSGKAWLDREWSSQFLQGDQSGWDWFALHLDSGEKLMLFRLRDANKDNANYRHAVLISPRGDKRQLNPALVHFEVLERSVVKERELPTHWRIRLTELDRELLVTALHPDQWMDVDFPYWEGVVTATGKSSGETGQGYLEMVGYPKQGNNPSR